MNQLKIVRDEFCSKCLLCSTCKNVCLSSNITGKAKILIVGEYPNKEDDEHNSIMNSYRDKLLIKIIKDVLGADINLFHFSYLVRCKPNDGDKPIDAYIDACFSYLLEEIEIINPLVIVTLGESVMNKLTGLRSVTKHRGEINIRNFNGKEYKILSTVSPAYIYNNKSALKNFANDIQTAYNIGSNSAVTTYRNNVTICRTIDDVNTLVSYIKQTGICSFDFETTGLNIHDDDFKATLISFSFQHGYGYVIPLEHYDNVFTIEELKTIIDIIKNEIFGNANIRKVAHNLKFDMQVARRYGIYPFKGRLDDTMLMHHLLNETKSAALKSIVLEYFLNYAGFEEHVKTFNWGSVPLDILANYASIDTDLTLRCCTLFESYLLDDLKLYNLYRNLTIPALKVLQDMEWNGALIDRDSLVNYIEEARNLYDEQIEKMRGYKEVVRFEEVERNIAINKAIAAVELSLEKAKSRSKNITKTILGLEQKLNEYKSGALVPYEGINFNSNLQLKDLLYGETGFNFQQPIDYSTGEDSVSTAKDKITQIEDSSGFIEDLLLARSLKKILSTYLEGIFERLDKNNIIHTSYLQHGTTTGRLSSRDPNLQNIPSSSKLSSDISAKVVGFVKKIFIPPKDHYIVQFDYAQAELRIIASFADETAMLEAYNNGEDLHALTAANMVGKTLDEFYKLDPKVQKSYRTKAKAGNFGLIYGMSDKGFKEFARASYGLNISDREALDIRNKFFNMYPNLLKYHANYISKAKKFGYVRTLFGRKRICEDINSNNNIKRGLAERVAVNSPIQGTAGEFTIFAIALLYLRLDKRVRIVNTIHDSIILYVPKDLLEYTIELVTETCSNLPTEKYFGRNLEGVSMSVDVELSEENWGSLKPYEKK
jgi:DNA polymerase-1